MPAHLSTQLSGAERYRSTAVVRARRIAEPRTWRTGRGSDLQGAAGDWLVTDGADEWTVAADVFDRTYRALPDGRFSKDTEVHALQVDRAMEVPTLEGPSIAEPGDWVLAGVDGELWPVTDAYFRAHYEPARPR